MSWRPSAPAAVLALRARLRQRVRDFFSRRGVMEVETPVLVSAGSTDPNVPCFAVHSRGWQQPAYLHTSPEHAMKRLLCAGSGDIYQLGPVFRDGEAGRVHNPEFTMIEWYRLGFDQHAMAAETVELVRELLGERGERLELRRSSYRELFLERLGFDPHMADSAELAAACGRHGLALQGTGMRRSDWLDLLFADVVARQFPDRLTVVYDFPAEQAALARVRPGPPPVAERFEVFAGALELANGFHELADAAEQRRRFEAERQRHGRAGRSPPPLDERLIAALEAGLPDCAGVALGFDRVVMLAAGKNTLAEVMAFPYDRN